MASVQTVENVAAELLAELERLVEEVRFQLRGAGPRTRAHDAGEAELEALAFPVLSLMLAALRGSDPGPAEPVELRRLARAASRAGIPIAVQLDALRTIRGALMAAFEERVRGHAGDNRLLLQSERRLDRLQTQLAAAVAVGHQDSLEERWTRDRSSLVSLVAVAAAVNRNLEIEEISRSGLVEMVRGVRADAGGLWLNEGDEGLLLTSAVGVNWEENRLLRAVSSRGSWLISMAACEPSPIQTQFRNGNAVISGFRAAVACRLGPGSETVGVVMLASRHQRSFSDADLGFVAEAAELLASAIERGRLHRVEARTDFLTGLANRQEFERAMDRELASAERHGRPVSMMLIDLDRLKLINDEHGHHAGDVAIRTVAELLRKEVRATDTCARLGGDEFALAMPGAELHQAEEVARRLRVSLASFSRQSLPAPLEISVGLATWQPGSDFERLFKAADARLYRDKRRHHARQKGLQASGA